ncbi:MAG: PAS domain S-box protein [Burkholderiales bacterium]
MDRAQFLAAVGRDRGRFAALLVTAILAALALLGYLVWSGHDEAMRAAGITTRNYAAILETRLDATLRRTDANLQELRHRLPISALNKQAVPSHASQIDADLDSHLVNFPELAGLRVIDAGGDPIYSSDSKSTPRTNIADRRFFRRLRDDPQAGLVISEVLMARAVGRPTVAVARALRDGQGRFHGIVTAALDVEYFQRLFRSLDLGKHGIGGIRRSDDFTQVVRWPPRDDDTNKPLPPGNPLRDAIGAGKMQETARYASSGDGVVRIFSVRKLERYPFYVVVALASEDVLAGWKSRSLAVGGAALLLFGLLAALLHRLRRSEARQMRTMTDLAGSEANLRAMSDNASVGILVLQDGRYVLANRHAARLLGYGVEELMNTPIADTIHPDDRAFLLDRHRRQLAGEEVPSHCEALALARNGSAIPIELDAAVTEWNGRTADIVFVSDITARKEAEAALRASEENYRSIYENIQDVYVEISIEGTILAMSPQIETLSRGQYTKEDFIGKPSIAFYADPKRGTAFIDALMAHGTVRDFEVEFRNRDGSPIHCSVSARLIADAEGRPQRIVSTLRDISERRLALAAREEGEKRYRTLVERSPEPIAVYRDGKLIYVNPATIRALGAARAEDLLGKPVLEIIHPDSHAIVRERMKALDAGSAGALPAEVRFLALDGRELVVEIQTTLIEFGGKAAYHLAGRDVTEQLKAEKERTLLEAQLRQSQKMEAVGTLAGGIAHDFNNIIGSILGNAELARQDVGADHPAFESIAEIGKAGRRARALVQQILAFSRKQALAKSVTELGPVLEEAARLLRATLPAGVRFAVACAPDAPAVLADATQIHQLLVNLCTNSWHAMEGRPGEIDVRLEAVSVDEALAHERPDLRPGRYVRLSVRDTGKGMDAATMERIFEPFFTTKPVGEGTGLGLSVVHGIVQGHGGAIVVESAPGKGSAFHLYFPAAPARATA